VTRDSDNVEVVLAWHAALNAADTDRLLSVSAADVEVGGPRGSNRGADVLREWVARAHILLEPARWHAAGDRVVVEQSARWQRPEGQMSESQTVASAFRVEGGKVASVMRYADFQAALASAGLDGSEE
jgi:ketosteroid isomerase-like protein